MVGHGGSSAGSYLTDPTSPIPSHCASIVMTSTVRVKKSALVVQQEVPYSAVITYAVNGPWACTSFPFHQSFHGRNITSFLMGFLGMKEQYY